MVKICLSEITARTASVCIREKREKGGRRESLISEMRSDKK